MTAPLPTRVLAAAGSRLDAALEETVEEVLEALLAPAAGSDGAADLLARLSDEELIRLKQGHRRAFAMLLDPRRPDDELEAEARRVGLAHFMASVRASDMLRLVADFGEAFHSRAHQLGLGPEDSEALIAVLRRRLSLVLRVSAAEMERLDEGVAQRVALLAETVRTAPTRADLVRRCLEVVSGIDGIVGVAYGRIDDSGEIVLEPYSGVTRDFVIPGGPPQLDALAPWSRAWATGSMKVVHSISADPRMDGFRNLTEEIGARSVAAVPIARADRSTSGVVAIFSGTPGFFAAPARQRALTYLQQAMGSALAELERQGSVPFSISAAYRAMVRTEALEMHYQPIVELRTGRVAKFEALARLRLADGGLVMPGEFLAALGADDLLELFDRGLGIALGQLDQWDHAGLDLSLSFNLPGQGLRDRRYLEALKRRLAESGVAPNRLTLELTEEEHLGDPGGGAAEIFWAMSELGVAFAQDDLGSGYSSLLRLENFGFEDVKIDQQLVRGASSSHHKLGLIQHLTRLAHDLRMRVVVEGLEDPSLIEAAAVLGADFGQGYGIARPMPAHEVGPWVEQFRFEVDVRAPRTALGAMAALRRWSAQLGEIGRYAELTDFSRPLEDLRRFVERLPGLATGAAPQDVSSVQAAADARDALAGLEEDVNTALASLTSSGASGGGKAAEADRPGPDRAPFSPLQLSEILALQNGILRSMAAGLEGAPLLDEVCMAAEATLPNSVATVMSVREGRLNLVAGPSLSASTRDALAVVEVKSDGGSCPAAVLSRAPVYVTDTREDPRWSGVVEIAEDLQLRACWSTPVFDHHGEVIGTFALTSFETRTPGSFHRNLLEICANLASVILERERVERELSLRTARLEHMFEGNQALKFIVDADTGELLEANRAALEFYGYPPEEMRSLTVFDLNVELTPDSLAAIAAEASARGGYHGRVLHRRADGELRNMDLHTHLYSEEGRRLFLSIVHDVTDQERAEQELGRERRISEAILNSLPGYVVVVDRRGRIVRFNGRAQEITGLSFEEAAAELESWRRWTEPGDAEVIRESFRALIEGRFVPARDYWQTSASGQRRLLRMTYAPVRSDDGEVELVAILGTDVTAEHLANQAIRWERDFSASIMDTIPQPIIVLDAALRQLRANQAMEELVGRPFQGRFQRPELEAVFTPEVYARLKQWLAEMRAGRPQRPFIGPVHTPDGESRVLEWRCVELPAEDGGGPRLVVIGNDITARLRESRELAQAAVFFDVSLEAIVVTDFEGRVLRANPAFYRISGFAPEEAMGMETMPQAFELNPAELFEDIERSLSATGSWSGTMWNRRKSGEAFPALMHISLFNAGESGETQVMTVFSDISAMVDYQQELLELAYHDQLTKLPNRAQLTSLLQGALTRDREESEMLGLVYLDLDDFKRINDTYGHAGGDRMLVGVAESLSGALRRSDCVARIGGDEFVCLIDSIRDESHARATLARLARAVERPVAVGEDGSHASVTASMGMVLCKKEEVDADVLLRLADHLMYEVKRSGGNDFVIEEA
ncbi:MAG: PAS domain S-box protein [Actinomycetota bacterium]|nr:PAS domain S-box protein [Actinomycetota bacterium]